MARGLRISRLAGKRIAEMPGVAAHVQTVAEQKGQEARNDLALHRWDGVARIEVIHNQGKYRNNSQVHLVDKAWVSIEYGHFMGPRALGNSRRWIEGLHILGKLVIPSHEGNKKSYLRQPGH